jgi:ribonucleoside-diphosphate reductase alpha chain
MKMSVEFFDEWFPSQNLKDELTAEETTKFEDPFSEEVWQNTYKDHTDKSIDDTIYRVAATAASVEATPELVELWTRNFYHMLSQFRATAGGRIYSNIGTEWNGTTLMNCFVSPRPDHDIDSLDGILSNLRDQSQTLKAEGGWGENFSYIRPRGAFIHGIGVETPGSVKYMEMFDKASEIITAGSGRQSENKKAKGKIRKGAMMGVLDVWHPDIIEFITAKQKPGRLTKFNLSVNCTDEFMNKVLKVQELQMEVEKIEQDIKDALQWCKDNPDGCGSFGQGPHMIDYECELLRAEKAVEEVDKWDLRFPDTQAPEYKNQWRGHIGQWEEKGLPTIVYKTVSVTWLWNLIMESTYNRAEPGVLFLDRANYFSPLNYKETIQATNPCGEQTLAPGGVCNLGSINLTQFVNESRDGFDLEAIGKTARCMVRFLDNINDISEAPLPEYEYSMKNKRRVGVGILGWGSALFLVRTRFGSQHAHDLRDQVMKTIAQNAYMASIDLAEEKGMFSLCEPELHAENPFIASLDLPTEYMDKLREVGIRNSSLLSVQPTGNTSILANVVSGGLEPVFMPEYIRTVIVNSLPNHIADVTPKWYEGAWHETEMFKFTLEGDEEILQGVGPNGTTYKIDKNRGLTKEVLCEDYSVRFLKARDQWNPTEPWAGTTANLNVKDHVEDLKGFARWVDSAMSKTVNVPNEYSQEDFKEIYLDAYRSGVVKGVTTYRAGTMTSVLSAKEEQEAEDSDEEIILDDVKLPASAPAVMKTIRAENRKWYLTVVYHEDSPDRPFALFVKTNAPEKNVYSEQATEVLLKLARDKGIPKHHVVDVEDKLAADSNSSKITRLISFCLRHGVLIRNIVGALDKVEDAYAGSFVFQIRKFLASYIKDGERSGEACSECSGDIVYSEGCKMCRSCGNSAC